MTHAVVRRVVADVLRRAVEDTWSRVEERRQAAWDFLYSRGAGALFAFFNVDHAEALRHIVEMEAKPLTWSLLGDGKI